MKSLIVIRADRPFRSICYFVFLVLLLVSPYLIKAQNLVPNGGFEILSECPAQSNLCNINLAQPWYSANNFGWPQVCNFCGLYPCQLPLTNEGDIYQSYSIPFTGAGSAIFIGQTPGIQNGRQYPQTPLDAALLPLGCYLVTFYVSCFDYVNYGIGNIGALFTPQAIESDSTYGLIPANPQVQIFNHTVILDTMNWVKVSGIFQAIGGEQYITIGNFDDDAHTITQLIPGYSGPPTFQSAYYLDDVSVIPLDSLTFIDFAGPDTSVAPGDSVYVGTLSSGLTDVKWYNSSGQQIADSVPGLFVHPTANTYYTVVVNTCSKSFTDTVFVNMHTAGIAESELDDVTVYPNPTSGEVHISLPAGGASYSISVTSVEGRQVVAPLSFGEGPGVRLSTPEINLPGVRLSTPPEINLNLNVPPGLYFIRITNQKTGTFITRKLIINP